MVAAQALSRRLVLPPSPAAILAAAAWRGVALDGVDDAGLAAALGMARRNHVVGLLARAYPLQLGAELAAVEAGNAAMQRTLAAAA